MGKSDFFTQSESEEIFIRGISGDTDEDGITQKELTDISKKIIGQLGKTPPTANQRKMAETKGNTFHHWYRMHEGAHHSEKQPITFGHTEKLPGNVYDCNLAADEWFRWFFTTPRSTNPYSNPGEGDKGQSGFYGEQYVFLMQKRGANLYFSTASPFQKPDVKSITLTKEAPLLIPAYNVFAATEMFPSLDTNDKLLVEIISDLLGIRSGSVNAKLDGQTVEPCCVIRRNPLRITGIPNDNVYGIPEDRLRESNSTLNILHGGFWMLIRPEALSSADHLLEFKVESVNYKMDVNIRINSLI